VIWELRHKHKVSLLLEISGLARSTYYYYAKLRTAPDRHSEVKEQITNIYHENRGRYGYRRITMELRNRGHLINYKTVQMLMKALGLLCRVRMKKYRSYRGEVGKIASDLLGRDFEATAPNQKWVTDVTEFKLFGQKLYLSSILDLFSRDIISYTLSERPLMSMTMEMLHQAFAQIPDDVNLILHSDQGWQYQHKHYQDMLKFKGIRQSMSRKGNCLDKAVMENFFGLLKSELLYLQNFHSMEHFKTEIVDYMDYYNNRRIKIKLKGLPPAIHRRQALSIS
jgi:putative transposase